MDTPLDEFPISILSLVNHPLGCEEFEMIFDSFNRDRKTIRDFSRGSKLRNANRDMDEYDLGIRKISKLIDIGVGNSGSGLSSFRLLIVKLEQKFLKPDREKTPEFGSACCAISPSGAT